MMDMLDRHEVRDRGDQAVFHGKLANDPLWLSSVAALRRYLTPFSRDKMGGLPLSMGPGNHDTLTKDRHAADSQKFIGLHLDSWDKQPLRLRHRSRNRLCINLGREARYSLFVNLPLMQMFAHLGLRDPEDIYADFRGLALGHRFMMARPEYPAVRLRIEPGEAYILPTDNLIHDGSTTGTAHPDITMTFIGRFAPTPVALSSIEAS
jgi:predicted Zn-dependent protease with MMP-like domain